MAILKPQIKEKILKNAKRQHPTKHLDQKDTKTKKSKLSGGLAFTFSWPGESNLPSFLRQLLHSNKHFNILIEQKQLLFKKLLLQLININALNLLLGK